MPTSSAREFCKTAHCPSSHALLRYRHHHFSLVDRAAIDIHLRECDFCSAELQLLMRHRSRDEEYFLAEMPGQLRRFAEGLLTKTAFPLARFSLSNYRQPR